MAYDVLKIHGDGDVNYVMCSVAEFSDNDITTLQENGLSAPEWGNNTIMLAKFIEDTNASSYTISEDIIGYRIQRYEADYDRLYEVVSVDKQQLYFEDYNLRNNKSYQYRIVPIYLKNGIETLGVPISTEIVYTDRCGWSILGTRPTQEINKYTIDYDNIWTFNCNVSAEPMRPVYNKVYTTGFGQYPKATQGSENYLEGGLSCLIGDVKCNGYVGDNIDIIEKWRAFCNNGELKLLRDLKGHVIPCSIKDTTYDINYSVLEQPTTISFNFIQLADRHDISVYGLGV